MNALDIQLKYKQIILLCNEKKLTQALNELQSLIIGTNSPYLPNIEQLQTSYTFLLDYFGKVDDPERGAIFNRILFEIYLLADNVNEHLQQELSNDYYYTQYRIARKSDGFNAPRIIKELLAIYDNLSLSEEDENIPTPSIRKEYEQKLNELFNLVWLSSPDTISALPSIEGCVPFELCYQIITASFLKLLERFSIPHLQYILDEINHPQIRIRQTALVCLFLSIHKHMERILLSSELTKRIKLILEEPETIEAFKTIQLQLLQSRETEKLSKRLNEEIFPDMIKYSSKIFNEYHQKENDSSEDDRNPEWESILEDTSFSNKMQELNKLQLEGADIHLSAFAMLKNTPFFQQVSNWFLPFDLRHSLLASLKKELNDHFRILMSMVEKALFLCNSDKYSLAYTLMSMPPQAKEMFLHRFAEESESLKEQLDSQLIGNNQKSAENASKQFIHDLYRFLKLFPYRDPNQDIFYEKLDIYNHPLIEPQLHVETLQAIAEYLMENSRYEEAVTVFDKIITKRGIENSELLQRKGYCYQKMDQYEYAINEYQKAELLSPDNLWILRKTAQCLRKSGRTNEALSYYLLAENKLPDSPQIALSIGFLYLERKQYEKALNYFYKVQFIGKNDLRTRRALAWTLLLMKRYSQAIDIYKNLVKETLSFEDLLNYGHTLWTNGQVSQAIIYYRKAKSLEKEAGRFEENFLKDQEILTGRGIKEYDIQIMLEKLSIE